MSKFDTILKDSLTLTLVRILETTKFPKNCMLFTVDFKSLYTNIPIDLALDMFKEFFNEFPDDKNEHVLDLLVFVLKNNIMEFNQQWFQQIMGWLCIWAPMLHQCLLTFS